MESVAAVAGEDLVPRADLIDWMMEVTELRRKVASLTRERDLAGAESAYFQDQNARMLQVLRRLADADFGAGGVWSELQDRVAREARTIIAEADGAPVPR